MNKRSATLRFERLYYVFFRRLERRVMLFIVALLIVLVAYQLLLFVPGLKKNLTTIDHLEGTPIHIRKGEDIPHG